MGLRDPLSNSVRRVFANPLLACKLSDPGLRRSAFHLDPRPQLSVPGATSRENPSSKIQRCRGEVAGSTINTLVLDKISREHPASRSGKVHCKQTMDEGREYRIQRTERKQEGVSLHETIGIAVSNSASSTLFYILPSPFTPSNRLSGRKSSEKSQNASKAATDNS